ncbi:class I SAM-dependent methyltransferase [Polaromonas sp. YR568]|uniref:class I SAM-dependent methyltransferase n=1 Tax=Polaromonas sp. YR568 TaxID=1855301 RepID=UPI00398BF6E8
MTKQYQFDPAQGIWSDQVSVAIPYSDGDEIENYLFSVIKHARDVSVISPEMASAIKDWPSEYHLSPVRHNLLRPFAFGPGQRVLELGCGCGSMTRYLGETGATVLAVEGSQRRAMITAQRCRDLTNVSIYRDNISEFESVEKFDYVTLIGVLEYARKFISADDPVAACLKHAQSFLKEDGALILAIENQLGLKYFNGCSEDHMGSPYFGINGLYGKNDPVTFGRRALAEQLRQSGFPFQEFFYPFPDYKLPGLILSEAGNLDARLRLADLLLPYSGWGYQETHQRAFDEGLAWQSIAANGLTGELANSFLIYARKFESSPASWLAKAYGRSQRHPAFLTETAIAPNDEGNLAVTKRPIHTEVPCPTGYFFQSREDSTYLQGRILDGDIRRAFAREPANLDDLVAPFLPWIAFLRRHQIEDTAQDVRLPAHFVDCIPANLIVGENGELHFIDGEWICAEPVPLAWVIVRGTMIAIQSCLENTALSGMSYRLFIEAIASRAGLTFADTDYIAASAMEIKFHEYCQGTAKVTHSLVQLLDLEMLFFRRLSHAPALLRQELIQQRQELARVKATRSWRFTGPFRAAWNLSRWIVKDRGRKSRQEGPSKGH